MKKQDIKPGKLYAVAPPSLGEEGRDTGDPVWPVKAEVVEVGVEREGTPRHDGVLCVLAERFRGVGLIPDVGRYGTRVWEPGEEFVVSVEDVERRWPKEADESIAAARVERYERLDRIAARLAALGLRNPPPAQLDGDVFRLTADRFSANAQAFDEWLRRIDPVEIAAEAVREVFAQRESSGGDFEEVLSAVLDEVRDGLAVSDVDLSPEANA